MTKRVLILLVLLGSPAYAEDREAAERYFRAGSKAYAAQNFAAAAINFDEAFKALPMPEIAFSAAQAYRRLYQLDGKPEYVRRAVELYQAYLANVKKGGRVGDAADNLAEMKRELDRLEAAGVKTAAAAPSVVQTRLGVNVSVPDQAAELGALREIGDATGEALKGLAATIDGKRLEPFTLVEVDAKEHAITVAADGYFPAEKKTVAVAGQSAFVDVELKPKPARVTVKTEDGARISVDGRPAAVGPGAPLELAAGKHVITILRSGRLALSREVTVARGEELIVAAPLEKTSRRRAVPWVVAGAGVFAAGAVTTGILALRADGRAADLQTQIDMGNRPPSDADRLDHEVKVRDRWVTTTWVLGGTAVATGAVAAFLYFFDTPSPSESVVVPTATKSGAGVSLIRRF